MTLHSEFILYTYNSKLINNYINKHLNYNYDREEFLHFLLEEVAKIKLEYLIKSFHENRLDNLLITICRNNIKSTSSTYYRRYIRDKHNELDINQMNDIEYTYSNIYDIKKISNHQQYSSENIINDIKDILRSILPNYKNINTLDWFRYQLFCHVYFEGYNYKFLSESTGFSKSKLQKDLNYVVKELKKQIKLKSI